MSRKPDELHDTVQSLEQTGAARTVEQNPRATVVPSRRRDSGAMARALELLAPEHRGVEIHATLGEGGMGVVRMGTQKALGRAVAVKSLKVSARSDVATFKLLREAWLTGSLEHPNIVPVYDVSLDADGEAQIVMKKIEGAPWSELLADEHSVRQRFHATDLLEWNLRVLMQVASAVHFAHNRGVVHRDLKPDNVMIGTFGEVYVVDWGLALSMEHDPSGRLPHVSEATELAGTPGYMAPEMLGGDDVRISPRTDVYLLGSMLFELATGRVPHEGDAVMAILVSVATSRPTLPSFVPAELAALVHRAMDPDPDARFENAEQLRLALGAFLEHRGAQRLSEEADARLEELLTQRAQAEVESGEKRLRLYHLFGECRFGYLEALRAWRDNEHAQRGLRRAVEAMVEFELDDGDPRAASVLLAEHDAPPEALAARIEKARHSLDDEQARKAKLANDLDPGIGRRSRLVLASVMGVVWTVGPLAWGAVAPYSAFARTHWAQIDFSLVVLLIGGGLLFWARESMLKTALNRRLVGTVSVTMAGQCALYMGCLMAGIPLGQTHVLVLLVWALQLAMVSLTLVRGLAPAAVVTTLSFFAAAARPAWAFYVMAVANFALLVNMLAIWALPHEELLRPMRERAEARRRYWEELLARGRAGRAAK